MEHGVKTAPAASMGTTPTPRHLRLTARTASRASTAQVTAGPRAQPAAHAKLVNSAVCAVARAGSCEYCEHGSWKEKGHTAPGHHTDECIFCAAGKFGDVTKPRTSEASHCVACAKGKYTLSAGRTTCDDCESCEPGFYRTQCGGSSAGTCPTCAQGRTKTTKGAWDSTCTDCPAGTRGDDKHPRSTSAHCAACDRGQYQDGTGTVACKDCQPCAPGTFRDGCGGSSYGTCPSCNPGWRKPEGQRKCRATSDWQVAPAATNLVEELPSS